MLCPLTFILWNALGGLTQNRWMSGRSGLGVRDGAENLRDPPRSLAGVAIICGLL